MNKLIFICLWCLCFVACNSRPTSLEKALRLSGANRSQLEQVLKHYSRHPADSLKYKVAVFLIENMPGHGWYEGEEFEMYKRWIDSTFQTETLLVRYSLYEVFFQQPDATQGLTRYEDIEEIDSNFLITHIDSTFSAIQKRPWLHSLSFEQLCEYVFPYRVENERPQLLFNIQDSIFKTVVAGIVAYDDMKKNANNIFNNLLLRDYRENDIVRIKYRNHIVDYNMCNCTYLAIENKWKGRLLLCPVVIDFSPAFPNRNDRHCWTAMMDNSRISGVNIIGIEQNKLGKIYRKTFARQPYSWPDSTVSEYVPPFFRTPFYKDVTQSYLPVQDVVVRPFVYTDVFYGYLCVFNDLKWTPVACTEYGADCFRFEDVGCGAVYLPVVYPEVNAEAISYPFILDFNGQIHILEPDTSHLISLKLTRKYPLSYNVLLANHIFLNTLVEASDYLDFRQKEVVGTFDDISLLQYSSALIRTSRKYRYWRTVSKYNTPIAECFMYRNDVDRVLPIQQKYSQLPNYAAAFDDDPLTYAYPNWQGNLVFDMGKPVSLSRIECLLRNDGNNIWPGHWYELNYYDGRDWFSLGQQEATGQYVEFENIPANALLWLKDLTTGRQERIFTYQEGQIYYW